MNDVARREVAADFLRALQTTPTLVDARMKIAKDDTAAIGALVARTLDLEQVPTAEDLHAMAHHVDGHLSGTVAEIQAANANAPKTVGFIALMQH